LLLETGDLMALVSAVNFPGQRIPRVLVELGHVVPHSGLCNVALSAEVVCGVHLCWLLHAYIIINYRFNAHSRLNAHSNNTNFPALFKMASEFENVHVFDGKWTEPFQQSGHAHELPAETLQTLRAHLRNPAAQAMLVLIEQDAHGGQNVDSANNVNALDVLLDICVMWERQRDSDTAGWETTLLLLDEQLGDNYELGRCPQGRTTRLIQVWRCLADTQTPLSTINPPEAR
jgi:hypothetical protein